MGARRIVAVGALLAAATLVGGCDWLLVEKDTSDYTVSGTVRTVSVTGVAVDLDVVAGPGPVVVEEIVRYNGEKPSTSHSLVDGTLQLRSAGCTAGKACRVRYRVTVPATTSVVTDIDAGTVETTALTGDLVLRVDAGQITAHRAASARTDVRVDVGDVDLRFAAAPSSVVVEAGTGAVSVALPGSGYTVDAHTGVGDTDVRIPRVAGAERAVDVDVEVGQITVASA